MLNIKTFQVNPLQENTYIISDETRDCVIIDCGAYSPSERSEISEYIDTTGLRPVALLSTHGHLDHNLGIGYIYERYGLKVSVHRGDERLLRDISIQGESMFGLHVDFVPHTGTFVNDGDEIRFGSHSLRCIATPGHTMGGVSYYCADEKALFSGDTLFRLSIGRTDLPGGSMFMIINSLRQLCQLPDDTTVYAGHGPLTTIGHELAHNPYMDR
ncbi:MAG: MBL fold metallo-hydrolase [Prevotella sp.]